MRGLKRLTDAQKTQVEHVASFTDAWIETQAGLATCFGNSSHLLQMRGLKPASSSAGEHCCPSHLLQMRGLKPKAVTVNGYVPLSHLLQMRGLKQDSFKRF